MTRNRSVVIGIILGILIGILIAFWHGCDHPFDIVISGDGKDNTTTFTTEVTISPKEESCDFYHIALAFWGPVHGWSVNSVDATQAWAYVYCRREVGVIELTFPYLGMRELQASPQNVRSVFDRAVEGVPEVIVDGIQGVVN